MEQIEQSLLPNIEDIPPFIPITEPTSQSINSFIKLYSSHSKYYMVLLGDNGDPAFAAKIKNNIKEKLKKQLLTVGDYSLEVDYVLFILSAMIGVLTYWFRNGEDISKERLILLIYDLMASESLKKLAEGLNI